MLTQAERSETFEELAPTVQEYQQLFPNNLLVNKVFMSVTKSLWWVTPGRIAESS